MSNIANTETTNTTELKRRGRKAGSSDSVLLTVAQLCQKFSENTQIPVRRTWLAKMEAALAVAANSTSPAPQNESTGDMPANMDEVAAEVAAETPAAEEKISFQIS